LPVRCRAPHVCMCELREKTQSTYTTKQACDPNRHTRRNKHVIDEQHDSVCVDNAIYEALYIKFHIASIELHWITTRTGRPIGGKAVGSRARRGHHTIIERNHRPAHTRTRATPRLSKKQTVAGQRPDSTSWNWVLRTQRWGARETRTYNRISC